MLNLSGGLIFDNNNSNNSVDEVSDVHDSIFGAPLCVPDDPIENLEWYPPGRFTDLSFREEDFLLSHDQSSLSGIGTEDNYIAVESSDLSSDDRTSSSFGSRSSVSVSGRKRNLATLSCFKVEEEDEGDDDEDGDETWELNSELTDDFDLSKKRRRVPAIGKRVSVDKQAWPEHPWTKRLSGCGSISTNASYGRRRQRKCKHCLTDDTPQWRAGPDGPGTLCNACGIRYKSGRLFPEYRPLASPSFLDEVHSNSHKTVMRIRKARHIE